ncbi:carbonic anhydrase [Cyanobacterium sp. IPPAS B-1200]|uniref:carbonic anhydrase n=1 Tax=Cyanobacterium sp. IPPAS B-1200 TaxID=1562720 RepID=UPI0008527112|nr:carbonic anhydrase [Cyanobacterium sp. IPPAS B-1200]OEJ79458.1 carbonic anhydrase [Cyanobacterium sp. IPPAS B-1200]
MKKLIEGLHRFHAGYFESHKELFEKLSQGQHPRILFITCSDSRIDPNLITQANVGDLFVIRNAGNIVPPYGATNGGEGASIEYAITALGIEHIIVCGHSHCGAMKGLLKMSKLEDQMPLVYEWLKQAEATRRLLKDNYGDLSDEEVLPIAIAENVLTQLENLATYPVIRSKLYQGKLALHAWVYNIESGDVLAYDPLSHDFVDLETRNAPPEFIYDLKPTNYYRKVSGNLADKTDNSHGSQNTPKSSPMSKQLQETNKINTVAENYPRSNRLSAEQAERIYKGSY